MRVLVTGGTGTIGSAIVKHLISKQHEVVILSRDEYKQHRLRQEIGDSTKFILGDIRSYDTLLDAMAGVDKCFHVAAMKHVSLCEENPYEAVQTNVIGTKNVIRTAKERLVSKVLAISTDKAVNPISVLGGTKFIMEKLLKAEKNEPPFVTKFASIRFGNIFDSRGSVFDVWKRQAALGEPITITDSRATRYFISIDKAVFAAYKAMLAFQGGETFIVDCGDPVNISGLAHKLYPEEGRTFVYSGLKAGERLHEELFSSNETPEFGPEGLMVV